MTAPRVSIVVPHYDRLQILRRTLEGVRGQTFTDWEAIVIDDNSPQSPEDGLKDFLADPRFRLIRLAQNSGPSVARNVGIQSARGTLVCFLDSDDLWTPAKLEKQVAEFARHADPDDVFLTTQVEKRGIASGNVGPARGVKPGETFSQYLFLNGGVVQTSTVMLSRLSALKIGFDADLRQFEDYLLFLKAGALGLRHVLIAEPLAIWVNDEREDRLSKGSQRNMDAAWRFLAAAEGLMDERSRLMFLTRHVGPLYIREQPLVGAFGLLTAVLRGMTGPRLALSIAANGLLPLALIARLKSLLRKSN